MAKMVEGDGEEEKSGPGGSNLGLSVSKFLPNKDSIDWGEGQALFKAITDGDIERMKECINASPTAAQAAAIARDDETGMTPLHYSADRGRADITEVLLANGAMVMIYFYSYCLALRSTLTHIGCYTLSHTLNPLTHALLTRPPTPHSVLSPHTLFSPHKHSHPHISHPHTVDTSHHNSPHPEYHRLIIIVTSSRIGHQ